MNASTTMTIRVPVALKEKLGRLAEGTRRRQSSRRTANRRPHPQHGRSLGDFATGHPGRFAGTYETSVRGLPDILVYTLVDSDRCVSILRVIHTARDCHEGE